MFLTEKKLSPNYKPFFVFCVNLWFSPASSPSEKFIREIKIFNPFKYLQNTLLNKQYFRRYGLFRLESVAGFEIDATWAAELEDSLERGNQYKARNSLYILHAIPEITATI